MVLTLLLVPALAEVTPTVRVDYVEVLEFKNGVWSTRYIRLSSGAVRLQTSAELLVIRTDSTSGLVPSKVFVDGSSPPIKKGSGFLWNSLILQLDGKTHDVSVFFEKSRQTQPVVHIVAVHRGEARPGENATVPGGIPGLEPAGFLLTVLVSNQKDLAAITESGFLLNLSEITLMGEKIQAAVLLVPRTTLSFGGGFLKCSYSYLYFAPRTYALAAELGGSLVLTFANHPSISNLDSNILPQSPPHLALLQGVRDVAVSSYNVSLSIVTGENLCGTRVSYRVIPPESSEVSREKVGLRGNTTILVRFYKGGLAAVDMVITTPPPALELAAPLYSLVLEFRDQAGELVPSGSSVLIQQGKVVGTAQIINGSSRFCGLPPDEYVVLAYRWGVSIAKRGVQVLGDALVTIPTNTTTVELQVLRQGTGELLTNYTAVIHSGSFAELVHAIDKARIAGVPPGAYIVDIMKDGITVASVNLTVSWESSSFSLTLPVYKLRVRVLNALDQPLAETSVTLRSGNISLVSLTNHLGVVDYGYLPGGEYTIHVEFGSYKHVERLTLSGDSVRTIRTSVIASLGYFTVTVEHIQIAVFALSILLLAVLLRSILKRALRRVEKVVEV